MDCLLTKGRGMEQRVKDSIEVLQIMSRGGLVVMDSGGKDSSVLTHIAMLSGVDFKVVHNLTTVDAPETVRFVKRKFEKLKGQGIEAEIKHPKETMWKLIERKLMPPTRLVRYCCSELKESYGKGEKIVTGVRKAESVQRKKNQGLVTIMNAKKEVRKHVNGEDVLQTKKGGVVVLNLDNGENRELVEGCYRTNKILINPLIDWDDEFLWWFIKHENIEINPLYCQGFKRVGCVGCPMGARKQREEEFRRYPQFEKAYINAFDKMIAARKAIGFNTKWRDGIEVMGWVVDEKYNPDQITIEQWEKEIGMVK